MTETIIIEDGEYGRRAVITSSWSDQIIPVFKDEGIVELELNTAKGWRGDDLSFLANLSHLQSFDILQLGIKNIEPIHFLHELKRLGVTTYCSTEIRFQAFPKLESCSLEWGKRNARSLFECKSLKKLFVNRYSGEEMIPFAKLVNLESLAILNSPIVNLLGLEPLRKLRSLRLANCNKITSLSGIEVLSQLEELDIHTCRSINSIEEVGFLFRLRKLLLNNDGNIDSLKPLKNIKSLELVSFYESTNIVDGDISPLKLQKNLARVSFQNRRHYSHRREDFGADTSQRTK